MPRILKAAAILACFAASPAAWPALAAPSLCSTPDEEAVTTPAPVDIPELMSAIFKVKTTDGKQPIVFRDPEKIPEAVKRLFSTSHPTSKLHQFYGMLHVLGTHALTLREVAKSVDLDIGGVRKILSTAKVVPSREFLDTIAGVQVESDRLKDYQYNFRVRFSAKSVKLPLNQGKGFAIFREGKCQHARAIIFYEKVAFRTRETANGNLLVHKFENVDLYGEFGTRNKLVSIDLNHVSLNEVEFLAGTNRGRVKAYVSEKEFEANKHPWLLMLLMRIVPDNSVQVIDW